MTEQPPHRDDRPEHVGDPTADPFGRPIDRSGDAIDAFGRPLRIPSPTASPVPVESTPASPAQPPDSATMALVLGIGGVFLPLILSIPAWIVGGQGRRESRALPGRPGYGMATTGWILGILGTIGWILVGLTVVLGVLWLIGSSETAYD